MRKHRHTPGPWTAEEFRGETRIVAQHIQSLDDDDRTGPLHIATVRQGLSGSAGSTGANMWLLAAAPEMFTTLEMVLDWATSMPVGGPSDGPWDIIEGVLKTAKGGGV